MRSDSNANDVILAPEFWLLNSVEGKCMSIRRVERDLNRFRQIVRGKIKKDLRKYMSQGEMIGRQGRKYVSIPLPQIDLPQFRYGAKQGGGVGQGDGDVGDPIGRGDPTSPCARRARTV